MLVYQIPVKGGDTYPKKKCLLMSNWSSQNHWRPSKNTSSIGFIIMDLFYKIYKKMHDGTGALINTTVSIWAKKKEVFVAVVIVASL